MTRLNLSADDLLTTTRSVRRRLDYERPVERRVVEECLEIAMQAPTGGNAQSWHWVVVEDPATKRALGDLYATNFDRLYGGAVRAPLPDDDPRAAQAERTNASGRALRDNLHRSPYILIPCIEGRPEQRKGSAAGFWGSVLPAVWSFMLALRERGLGSAWTTTHLLNDGEQRAADIIGIPYEMISQAGLFPIAYTQGTDFRRARRVPLERVVHWDRW